MNSEEFRTGFTRTLYKIRRRPLIFHFSLFIFHSKERTHYNGRNQYLFKFYI